MKGNYESEIHLATSLLLHVQIAYFLTLRHDHWNGVYEQNVYTTTNALKLMKQ